MTPYLNLFNSAGRHNFKESFKSYWRTRWFWISTCLDDSKEEWSEVYLIQTKRDKEGKWMGCINDSGPLLFGQREDALVAIKNLKLSEMAP